MSNDRYLMSFVTGGLYIQETLVVAQVHKSGSAWAETAVKALNIGAFPVRKEASAKRTIREITHRLRSLSDYEFNLLLEAKRDEQVDLIWLGVCRAYRFIGEFTREVVSERFAGYRTDLSYGDFDAFFSRKAEWSDQLANILPTTKAKLRAVTFRFMREAGLIGANEQIVGSLLSSRISAHLRSTAPDDLGYFPGVHL